MNQVAMALIGDEPQSEADMKVKRISGSILIYAGLLTPPKKEKETEPPDVHDEYPFATSSLSSVGKSMGLMSPRPRVQVPQRATI